MSIDFKKIEQNFQPAEDGKATFSKNGMISTQSSQATEAGVAMLKKNGNAVDAAVAAAFTLGVSEPQASGLGGQTMMLIHHNNKTIAIDGSSRAPSLAHANAIYKRDRMLGYRATTIPSTLAALSYVHQKYGALKWEEVLEPAIQYAADGYPVSELQHKLQKRETENFSLVPSKSGYHYFLNNGQPYLPGEIFKQPDLANLLKTIAQKGIREFYKGKIAKQIDADMRENGGLLRYDDLALIPFPIERMPLKGVFRNLDILTMPPPGSGRTFLFVLQMLELMPHDYTIKDEKTLNLLLIHILRKAFLERKDRPFDPNFFSQIADETEMLDPAFAWQCLNEIIRDVDKSMLPLIPSEDEMSGETTHLSVIDKKGNAVSLTQSIERVYGSKAAAQGLGFLYNNYLYDYEYNIPEHPYYLRPNNPPWATVTPSLVFNKNKLWMALGSPGSERIIPVLTKFLLFITDRSYSISGAINVPRIHCSLGGRVSFEKGAYHNDFIDLLKEKGFRIDEREPLSFYLGCIQAVLKTHDNKGFQGIADIRRDGTAKGL